MVLTAAAWAAPLERECGALPQNWGRGGSELKEPLSFPKRLRWFYEGASGLRGEPALSKRAPARVSKPSLGTSTEW